MLAPADIKRRIAGVFDQQQAQVLGEVVDSQNDLAKASDFVELKSAVERLAEAQTRTENRVGRVEAVVERLAAAQERTDRSVATLADVLARTDNRVGRVEAAVERLAEAQTRTEAAMMRLATEVGSLKNDFALSLEEFSAALLPPYLARHFGVQVRELERRFFDTSAQMAEEVDLVAEGVRDGQPITVLVECTTRIGGSEVRRTAKKFDRVAAALDGRALARVIVSMVIHPTAVAPAEEHGIWLIPYSRINRERE